MSTGWLSGTQPGHLLITFFSDLFYITQEDSLFPTIHHEPAKYDAGLPFILPDGRTAEIDDVCDFVVKYIDSDVLVLTSTRQSDESLICSRSGPA
jgi:hypothetical protein